MIRSMTACKLMVEDVHGEQPNEAKMKAQEASPSALLPPSPGGDGPSTRLRTIPLYFSILIVNGQCSQSDGFCTPTTGSECNTLDSRALARNDTGSNAH